MVDLHKWEDKIIRELQLRNFTDGSHDLDHFKRVTNRALRFNVQDSLGGNPLIILAAGLLHDMVEVPKNSPNRSKASRMSADAAVELLQLLKFPSDLLSDIHHAIAAHSFSAKIAPTTVEAKCLQDADRVEALGAMGIARCFYTTGRMDGDLVDWKDPLAKNRSLDDTQWALDHFEVKLFFIPEMMQTVPGRMLAESLRAFMKGFREKLLNGGPQSPEYQFAVMCLEKGRQSLVSENVSESFIDGILAKKTEFDPGILYFITQLENELEQ